MVDLSNDWVRASSSELFPAAITSLWSASRSLSFKALMSDLFASRITTFILSLRKASSYIPGRDFLEPGSRTTKLHGSFSSCSPCLDRSCQWMGNEGFSYRPCRMIIRSIRKHRDQVFFSTTVESNQMRCCSSSIDSESSLRSSEDDLMPSLFHNNALLLQLKSFYFCDNTPCCEH